jgi:hypothetical protein
MLIGVAFDGKSRYNFGTTEREREGPPASKATPNEALGILIFIVRDQGSEVQILSPRPYTNSKPKARRTRVPHNSKQSH